MLTTTIGAFPKPGYVPITDWFTREAGRYTEDYLDELAAAGDEAAALLDRATAEVIADQVGAGIDIPTDGEIRRENYVHYQCRHLDGIDFDRLTEVHMRGTTWAHLPTVTGPIKRRPSPLVQDFTTAQATTDRPVKVTLPGPMTIMDTTVDDHYHDRPAQAADLAAAINAEILDLVAAGARWIQVDEPLMARQPDDALAWGVEQLDACFAGVSDGEATRTIHICCGYPNALDQTDYPKAPQSSYHRLASAIDDAPRIDAVSLEDAHRHNDLATLLPHFASTTVILGVVAIADSRVESVDEIRARLTLAAEHAPAGVIAAPDCGLGYLSRPLAVEKLRRLCAAADGL
ncbi:MAG: 5-methyltetrahydropteroyltriglutamate--homocysteine methyltransferase [Actinomycetota bacterium]